MNNTPNPSFADVEQELASRVGPLLKATVYGEYAEPANRPIHYRSVVREKTTASKFRSIDVDTLKHEQMLFLRNIRAHPHDGILLHFQRIGGGASKLYARFDQLKASGYVETVQVPSNSPRGGRSRLVPRLTPAGLAALETYESNNRDS